MKKVLVIDDEPVCALFLGSALKQEGYDVQVATRADEAILLGNSFHPDFLITDWMLKDAKDGIDVARTLRVETPGMRIIFITGMSQEMLKKQAHDLEIQAIVVKPIDIDELVALMKAPPAT
jgi:DNA-binding response OmpR family regulator